MLTHEQITIAGDQSRYLSLVLRVKSGDRLTIFDGSGYRYECTVLSCHKKEV
ncbi:MAG: RNA methyltransferase PUA domain-containing protein, partial [Nitrospirota bacterium]